MQKKTNTELNKNVNEYRGTTMRPRQADGLMDGWACRWTHCQRANLIHSTICLGIVSNWNLTNSAIFAKASRTDRRMDAPSYRDARTYLTCTPWVQRCVLVQRSNWRTNRSSGQVYNTFNSDFWSGFAIIFGENYAFLYFLQKHYGRTDAPEDGRTYRDARTHLKTHFFAILYSNQWGTRRND